MLGISWHLHGTHCYDFASVLEKHCTIPIRDARIVKMAGYWIIRQVVSAGYWISTIYQIQLHLQTKQVDCYPCPEQLSLVHSYTERDWSKHEFSNQTNFHVSSSNILVLEILDFEGDLPSDMKLNQSRIHATFLNLKHCQISGCREF